MERNIKIRAITLKKIKIGESNIGVTLLTEDDRVLFVMAFGAAKPKSRLFSSVNPFVFSMWNLYYDPIKDLWRGKDSDVIDNNSKLQLSIEKFYIASFFSEIILKSQGSAGVFSLLYQGLVTLSATDNRDRIIVQFILRYLLGQGILPSFEYCDSCERRVDKESLYYIGFDEFSCSRCLKVHNYIELTAGAIIYWDRTRTMDITTAINISLELESLLKLKKYCIALIRKHTEGKLSTLDSADGLI
ncbi:MAG: DNA repair protein RecO [Spirochaetaceae bacterium 4572_7]|nr:MAG: DNA repair protein RecO [Spirochaetaceae bacterium 4572_7]